MKKKLKCISDGRFIIQFLSFVSSKKLLFQNVHKINASEKLKLLKEYGLTLSSRNLLLD